MALPTSPKQPSKGLPTQPKPGLPTAPVTPGSGGGLPTAPKPMSGGGGLPTSPQKPAPPKPNVGVGDVSEEQLQQTQKSDYLKDYEETALTKRQKEYNLNTGDEGVYQALSKDIGAEEILNEDYDTKYKHLEPVIIQTLDWVQDTLNEREMSPEVAKAREMRGKYLKDMRVKIDKLLLRYFDSTPTLELTPANYGVVSAFVINEILGLGPIEPLWEDSRITEIMVNGPQEVRVEIGGKIIVAKGAKFRDKEHLIDTVNRILQPLNKSLDNSHPEQDGRLYDGSRLHALHPAVVPSGPVITIRRFPETVFSVKTLVDFGAMTPEIAATVGWLIHSGCSSIIAGGTGSGKTSMLNALSGCIPLNERIISIEDNLELRLNPNRHWVPLETRVSAHGDKTADKDIRALVRASLRMRPDRIVVGEVRDEAAYDMLQAMNTGHEGSMTTVHANDPQATVTRLVNLVTQSKEMDSRQAASLIANSVDLFVNIARYEDGSRRISHISEIPSVIEDPEQGLITRTLWEFKQTGTEKYVDDKGRELERVVGEYIKVNDISEELVKRHRLNYKPRLTAEEVYAMSSQEGEVVVIEESSTPTPVSSELSTETAVEVETAPAEEISPEQQSLPEAEPTHKLKRPEPTTIEAPYEDEAQEAFSGEEKIESFPDSSEPETNEEEVKPSAFLSELMKLAEEQNIKPPEH